MPSGRRQFLLFSFIILLSSLAVGTFSGGRAVAATAPDEGISQSVKSFTRVYDLVEQNFADSVKPDKAIYDGAIPGMLRTLDPHSNFFDPKAYAAMREEQRARYYGVGMLVGTDASNHTIVRSPFVGSPAIKAGLRPGDVIVEVDDKKTEGLGQTQVVDMIKGPRRTYVQLKVARQGQDQPLTFNLMRDEIPRPSVSDAFWLRQGIAYIEVKNFTDENTAKEMEDKLKKLGEKDIKGLVLDLRDNPGGLLTQGIEVAGHFLKKNQLVVSHRGRTQPNKNFTARTNGEGHDYPIVVVVNRRSASAAEIVSGALQDHDRAWILGETTFGKGLVQSVFPLSNDTALALTTMHYYTPSGRLIQRDYTNISFLDYYTNHNDQKNAADVKMTDSGRTVYGGGGITPDEKFTVQRLNKFQIEVLRNSGFFNFSAKYFGPMKDAKLPKGWEPDEKLVNDFHGFLLDSKIEFTEGDFTANHQWVKEQLKREMYVTAFSVDESDRVRIEQDPEVTKAIEAMPKAQGLIDKAKKLVVQRIAPQPERAQ
ncbi:MAG TPA: S41 family peptidase [Bryobacteraceae bacterium]|nr:S41 family peptidase [Bryobacteraceae bacterium]